MKKTRKQVRSERLWKHWLYWLSESPFGRDMRPLAGYSPEQYRGAFEHFQSSGRKGLTETDLEGIHPLLCAQKAKEVFLTSLAEESMEWWAKGWGWIHPWQHTLDTRREGKPLDRLTHVAILRTVKKLAKDPFAFFQRHPGIPDELKLRYLSYVAQ